MPIKQPKKHKPRPYFHMLPQDRIIWRNFVYVFEQDYDEFHYDVRVGPVPPPLETLPPNIRELAHLIYRLRIDVVAYKDGQPYIIEVKPNAGLSCLGQLLTYDYFWRKEKKSKKKPRLMAVTNNARPYMPELFENWRIQYVVV